MYYQYGYYKPLAARKLGRLMTLRQLAPAGLLVALAAGALGTLLWAPAGMLALALGAAYTGCVGAVALAAVPAHGLRCALALTLAFPTLHLSYGCGFLRGAWSVMTPGRRRLDPAAVPLSR
jgi:hypothetical protein